ncbi:SCP2 sterol-binding domain-containing protein [Micromonospora chalcea]|uniref:SCP2 sterol-binding domain-containing protein n=1 Tax=Micromonospora chalcea TaxID=1874 RepID=UPI000CE3D3A9|nr:SCP2 sterol-binding domain-containing protein [Micromonospora chalcea]PPA59153.1 hypothetical protein BAW75_17260 [Micromonospora chalcea]
MVDATEEFFQGLGQRRQRGLTALHEGTVRFDIAGDGSVDHWLVSIARGEVTAARQATGGDAVVRADRAVFDRIARGEAYFLTTVLRGEAEVEGSPRLFATVRRLFPSPPGSRPEQHRGDDHG